MKIVYSFLAIAGITVGVAAADKKLELKDLPPAVQLTIQQTAKGGEIKGLDKEKEKGVTQYEVETLLNGKHRDFEVDTKGTLLVLEEETAIDSIPAPARAAIMKKVGTGKIALIETSTKPGQAATYEVSYTTKAGKKSEYQVKGDGTEVKD